MTAMPAPPAPGPGSQPTPQDPRSVITAGVFGLVVLRVVLAMLLPSYREPNWADWVVLAVAVVAAIYLAVTGPVSAGRLAASVAAALFWLAPAFTAYLHQQEPPVASAAMAAVAAVLILGPATSSLVLRIAVGAGAGIVLASLVYGTLSATDVATGAFHTVGDYQRTTWGVPALRGITLHPNTLGGIAAATLVLSLAIGLANRRPYHLVVPLLSAVALIWSQSRSSIGSAILAVLALLLTSRWLQMRVVMIGAALVLSVLPVIATYSLRGVINMSEVFNGRDLAWEPAYRVFRESPVTGFGPDALSEGFWETQPDQWWEPLHAHNEWLENAAQAGLVGLIPLLALILIGIVTVLRRTGRNAAMVTGLTMFVGVQAGVEVPFGLTYFPVSYLLPAMVLAAFAFSGPLEWKTRS